MYNARNKAQMPARYRAQPVMYLTTFLSIIKQEWQPSNGNKQNNLKHNFVLMIRVPDEASWRG